MDKKKVLEKHKKILKIIKRHNKNYFIHDNPEISDYEYDKIKSEILQLEKKYPYLQDYGSIQNIVGAKPQNKFNKSILTG